MRYRVLALDYDGTIAEADTLVPAVRAAIAELRARGLVVVLVTGRILDDLRRVAGDLRLFDAVVGENGAVVLFPGSGQSLALGDPPPRAFLDALRARGVAVDGGACVLEADAASAPTVLAVIREQELPLTILFNRGRLMVLPEGISKGTGLRQALRALRESEHNAMAIGDAENDHTLLAACERGVAVAWGSAALRAQADEVLPGRGPADVAPFLRASVVGELPPTRSARHRVVLGHREDGAPLTAAVQGRTLLVVGDPRSGKSWVAGLLAEQLILRHYGVCLVDPEGDYRPLEELPGVLAMGGDDPPPRPRELWRALQYPDVSVVIDLARLPYSEKRAYVASLLPLLARLRQHAGLPHWVVLDEAHYFLAEAGLAALGLEQGGYVLVTYRADQLPRAALAASSVVLATRITDPHEAEALLHRHGAPEATASWLPVLAGLSTQEAVRLPGANAAADRPVRFRVAPRLTLHVRHRHKYLDVEIPEALAFVFTRGGTPTGPRARTLREFTRVLSQSPLAVLDGHLRRSDFSRWVGDVFGDHPLARRLQELEELYALGHQADVQDALVQCVEERYGLGRPAERPDRPEPDR